MTILSTKIFCENVFLKLGISFLLRILLSDFTIEQNVHNSCCIPNTDEITTLPERIFPDIVWSNFAECSGDPNKNKLCYNTRTSFLSPASCPIVWRMEEKINSEQEEWVGEFSKFPRPNPPLPKIWNARLIPGSESRNKFSGDNANVWIFTTNLVRPLFPCSRTNETLPEIMKENISIL